MMIRMTKLLRMFGLAFALATVTGQALGDDRALLIGVSDLQDASLDGYLPGIDLDMQMMRQMAESLGFSAIKEVRDSEASLAGVKAAFESWLINGTKKDDRVLIYFSGHGTQVPDLNGDENGGFDDALVLYDAHEARYGGQASMDGVLVDDEFGQILGRIRSRNVLVVLDACHSGTATKAVKLTSKALNTDKAVMKFLRYAGMPSQRMNFARKSFFVKERENYVALSAARDDQQALASTQGSFFTRGLHESLMRARGGAIVTLTPNDLLEDARAYIEQNVEEQRHFEPQLGGNPALAAEPLHLVSTVGGGGPLWRETADVVKRVGGLSVRLNKPAHRVGELLEVVVDVPWEGYLNVIDVGPNDVPTVLFPNQFHSDNLVRSGPFQIPTAKMTFDLSARKPYGASLIAAFLSREPINLYEDGTGTRDIEGVLQQQFVRLSAFSQKQLTEKSFGPRASFLAGMAKGRVCAPSDLCSTEDAAAADRGAYAATDALTPGIFLEPLVKAPLPPGVELREIYPRGLQLTKDSEGFRARLYHDAAGYCTIAYGHLVNKARCDGSEPLEFRRGVTEPRGAEILKQDMEYAQRAVINAVDTGLTDGQYAALCDFTYNVGTGNLQRSTLLKVVNARRFNEVPFQFRRWNKAGGMVLAGLQKRREREIELFFDGLPRPKAVPAPTTAELIDIRIGE